MDNTSNTSVISVRTGVRPSTDKGPTTCWCGQDVDPARVRHCPRCGTACATRVEAHLPRLAA